LSQKKIEELKSCKKMSKVLLPNSGKKGHFMQFSVSGCNILINFLLLGYSLPMHKSVGRWKM
jgi:hypothetical protein